MGIGELIKPCTEKHSIKEVVISVFLANPFYKPVRFQNLIETDFKDSFQQFENVSRLQVNFQKQHGKIESPIPQIIDNIGFKFVGFENGRIVKVLQGINEENRTVLSYHCLNYNRWEDFFQDYIDKISVLTKHQTDFFIKAYSLHYIDEFTWIADNNTLDLGVLFKTDGRYLPREFFNSEKSNFSLTTETSGKFGAHFDRLEVKVETQIRPVISISHNFTQPLDEVIELKELISLNAFSEILNYAHLHNKDLLGTILTDPIKDLIKLNNGN